VDALRNLLSVFVTRKFVHVKNMIGLKSPLEILLKMLWSMPEALIEEVMSMFNLYQHVSRLTYIWGNDFSFGTHHS
jgi:hypothetical protein